jgi:Tol biopolymer transport system component
MQVGKDLLAREEAFLKAKFKGAARAVDYSEPSSEVKDARRNKLEVEALETLQSTMALPDIPQSAGRSHATNTGPLSVHVSGFAALIQTDLLDPVMAPAREAAWTLAKGSATLAQYPVLLDAFGSAPLLQQDVQFVLTRIVARSIDGGGNTLASSTLGFDVVPDLPADPKRSDTLTLRPGGTLALSGNIANLECADAGEETLTVTFEGVQVACVSGNGGNLLAGALGTFTPATQLSAAGLPAGDTSVHTLLIRRSVSPCAATLGLTDDLLATVTVRLGAPPRLAFIATPLIDPDHHADQWMLQAVDASGGAASTLLTGTMAGCAGCPGYPAGPASWSPDGRRLVYAGYTPATLSSDLWIANADGSGATLVPGTSGASSPHWTPDGKTFVFASAGNIMSLNIDGTSPLALTSSGNDSGPVLSGDGKRIAFFRSDPVTGTGGYFVMNADGSGLMALPPPAGPPALSPDGTQVAFVTYNDVNWQIMVANVDDSGQHEVYSVSMHDIPAGEAEPRVLHSPVSWSPEGNQIAFAMYRVLIVGEPDGKTWNYLCATDSIWLVKSDGAGPTEVMHSDSTVTYGLPAWSQ